MSIPSVTSSGVVEFTVRSTGDADSGWTMDPFDITVEFWCCEGAGIPCDELSATVTVEKGDTPKDTAEKLRDAICAAAQAASCEVDVEYNGGRMVSVYGPPPDANPDCTPDDPCFFPPDASEGQTEPYIVMNGYNY